MLTAEQLRAVIQQQMSYQRVRRLQQRDWADLNVQNQLARQLIQVDDLQFLAAIQKSHPDQLVVDFNDYGSVKAFISANSRDLSPTAQQWLLAKFK